MIDLRVVLLDNEHMKKLCNMLCLIYVVALVLILAVDQTNRADFPLLALMTTFSILLFVPLIFVALYALWQRSWMSWGTLLVGGVLLLAAHPVFPQKALFAAGTDGAQLEVMTFNVGLGISSVDRITQVLTEQSAEIVGVQEAIPDQINHFNSQLRNQYPYQTFDPKGTGVGLLSRYEIVEESWLQPPTNGRPMLHAQLDINDEIVHVFVAHVSWPTILRTSTSQFPHGLHEYGQAKEVYFLQQQAEAVSGPVIMMGDFNMSDQSHSYKELTANFGDAFRDGGWGLGFTFPNYRTVLGQEIETPILRIDYIFYDEVLDIQQAEVTCFENGSDHCALRAIFSSP